MFASSVGMVLSLFSDNLFSENDGAVESPTATVSIDVSDEFGGTLLRVYVLIMSRIHTE